MTAHFLSFNYMIDQAIRREIAEAYPLNWDEDYITMRILAALRKGLNGAEVVGYKKPMKIACQAYKLKGKAETNFGDVAVIVNIQYRDSDRIEGVGFWEAKKRDVARTTFSALKTSQLQRINRNAPHAQVVLYDYEETTAFACNADWDDFEMRDWLPMPYWGGPLPMHHHPRHTSATQCLAVPMQNAIAVGRKDTALYKMGIPLYQELCQRYMHGFDFDMSKKALALATGYADSWRLPKYVMHIVVAHTGEIPRPHPMPNDNVFQVIE
jgi:hypothetical protein